MKKGEHNLDILVVDDDADIGLMIKSILSYYKFRVNAYLGAEQMLDALKQQPKPPQLIIMDMLLSGTDGRDICRKLKSSELTKEIPVLMISAHPNAKETCIEAGANDFLEKPFDLEMLINKSRQLMHS